MTISADVSVPIQHTDRFFIGGEWVTPSSDSTITVIDSHTEQNYLTVAEA
jgi:aldehyde dehydrogenase (NAD+)